MHEHIKDDFFLDVYKFRCAFNVQPDIVIHINKQAAVCVEAKFESKESKYPTSKSDKEQFKKRLGYVRYYRQTEIQKYMFENVLGMENTEFVLLAKKKPPETKTPEGYKPLTWAQVFDEMKLNSDLEFVKCWVDRV